jgi:DNA-binding transcriptional regulator YdaS (Cro superfamily)
MMNNAQIDRVTKLLELYVETHGGQSKLAKELRIGRQRVWNWMKGRPIAPELCQRVETVTGISKADLRPDVFGEQV